MRFKKPAAAPAHGDLTPMIDMTFQLIAFFMVLINFTEADQNERIKLPISEIVKPPDGPMEEPIFLHLTKEGIVILGGIETTIAGAKANLIVEANILKRKKSSPADATASGRPRNDTRRRCRRRASPGAAPRRAARRA